MKKTFTLLLVALVGLISAQAAGLDYGQWSQEPWTAKYFYGTDSNGLAPDENWFAKDFDDSEWDDIQGPISNSSTSYYYVTEWEVSWSTYWLRRHFTVDETAKSYLLLITHDDGAVVYINGQEVYNYGYAGASHIRIAIDSETCNIAEGDNVIAVKIHGGGSPNTIDFGLYAGEDATGIVTESNVDIKIDNNSLWPWLETDDGMKSYNMGAANTESVLSTTVTVLTPTLLTFDYTQVGYSSSYDWFKFTINDSQYLFVSGRSNSGKGSVVLTPGTWDLKWIAAIDQYVSGWETYVIISNVRLSSAVTTLTTDTYGQVGKQAIYAFDRLDNPELNFIKIVGPVGSAEQDDWNDLRNMTYLMGLDLSEAQFDEMPNNALENLGYLSYVVLPDNVTSIGDYAFQGTQLFQIDIPAAVTSIGYQAFYGTKVREVNFLGTSQLYYMG